MLIKITEINKNESIGDYPAAMITGKRIDGKGEWSKKFFSNNQTLMMELDEYGIGETVNVRMTKGKGIDRNGNPHWNIAGFEEANDDLIASVKGGSNPTLSKSGGDGSPTYVKKNSWSGRTGEAYDRSAAVYLAWDIVKTTQTETSIQKIHPNDMIKAVLTHADIINNYIHNGDDGSDPLNPPEVD